MSLRGFNLYLLGGRWLILFSCVVFYFIWEVSVQVGLFVFLISTCSSLHVLDAGPLCQIQVFMDIFSQSVTYILTLLIVSFGK